MKGREKIDIINERATAIAEIEKRFGESVEEIKSFLPENKNGIPLECLGKSIVLMAHADAVYFCKGWENARGCRIEHECAIQYGLEIIEK